MAAGDHIRVKRLRGLYYHHGIDMGDGTVIHFSGEPLNGKLAKVCLVSEEEFLKGESKEIIHYVDDLDALPVEESLRLAMEHLDKRGYNVLYNNCEHFASYCKVKKRKSGQVQSWIKATMVTAGAATALALVFITKTAIQTRSPKA